MTTDGELQPGAEVWVRAKCVSVRANSATVDVALIDGGPPTRLWVPLSEVRPVSVPSEGDGAVEAVAREAAWQYWIRGDDDTGRPRWVLAADNAHGMHERAFRAGWDALEYYRRAHTEEKR